MFPAPAGVCLDGGGVCSGWARVTHEGAVVGTKEGGIAPCGGDAGLDAIGELEATTFSTVGHSVGEGIGIARGAEGSLVPKVVGIAVVLPTAVDAAWEPVVEVQRPVASQAPLQGYRRDHVKRFCCIHDRTNVQAWKGDSQLEWYVASLIIYIYV